MADAPERVWAFLWDVPQMAESIPGCREAVAVDPHQRYRALLTQRVGPFQVDFAVHITVADVEPGRSIRLTAQGKDTRLASQARGELLLTLEPEAGGGSIVTFEVDIDIVGKLMTLGHSLIARKGEEMMRQFGENLRRRLETKQLPVDGDSR